MKFGLTAKYHTSLLYPTPYKIGLDAMIPQDLYVFQEELKDIPGHEILVQSEAETKAGKITKYIKKGQLAQIIIPNTIKYTLEQGIADGILSPYQTVVINHALGTKHNYMKLYTDKNTKQPVYGTEKQWYVMRDRWRKDTKFPFGYRMMLSKQLIPDFLYKMKTKAIVARKIIELYPGSKFLIFGVRKELLYDITKSVCEPDTTDSLVEQFNQDKIRVIASSKMIQQGRTLAGLTDIIIVSYYKSSSDFLQRLGRLVRFKEGKVGRVWIIRTTGTLEANYVNTDGDIVPGWFTKMHEIRNSDNELIDTISREGEITISSLDLFKPNFKL